MRLSHFFTVIAASCLILSDIVPARAADEFITIGTGNITGVYYPAGGAVCRLVNRNRKEHGIRCSVESTGGSIYNLEAIRQGELDIGIAQSDWHYNAFYGRGIFADEGPNTKLRSLFSLHSEAFTVVVPKASDIKKFDDLRGHNVNIGDLGSGMRATMEAVMAMKGWNTADFKQTTELKPAEQVSALCGGQIDAMIFAAGHPNGLIQEVTNTCPVRIIPVDGPDIDKLIEQYPYYAYTTIPGGMYPGTSNPVRTFGVKATFVTSDELPQEVAYEVVKAVFDNFESFKTLHFVFAGLKKEEMVRDSLTAPLHAGAIRYYKEIGLLPATTQ